MRLAFNDFDSIVDLCFFILVVGVTNGPLADDLSVKRVPDLPWNFYTECLCCFCAGDNTNKSLFQRTTLLSDFDFTLAKNRKNLCDISP